MITTETWTCPTCAQPCQTRYCGNCGERALHRHDLTLFGLAEQAVETVTHFDGRVPRTFRSLVTRPGLLTESYVRGQRKPILGPLQVFLIANVVFFAFQSLFHASVFSNPLEQQLHQQYYQGLARRLVAARLDALHTTEEQYAPAFDHAVIVNAKSLIILMTPPMALLAAALFSRPRRPFITHVVFAIHYYAYWLLVFCVMTPIVGVGIVLFMRASGTRLTPGQMDVVVSYVLVGFGVVYLRAAAERVYAARGLGRALKITVLAITAALTVIGYRFVVFLITLYTTRPG